MNKVRHFPFPYRDVPFSIGAPDTIEANAKSSRTARMTVFMMCCVARTADGMLWQVAATEVIARTVRRKWNMK